MSLFSAAKIAQLKNTASLHFVQTRLLSCALFAHHCNSFQNSHFVQLLHFKDQFIATTGYNRKYAIHVLKNSAYVKVTNFNNAAKKSVQVITKTRKKRTYKKYYGADVQEHVIRLWSFSMYLCSKRLVPFIRDNIDYFAQKFGYDEHLKALLSSISSATVGRILKPEIPKHSIRGISTTRPAKNLNKLIPIRTFFDSCGGFKSLMKGLESDCNHLMRTPYLAAPR